MKPTEVLMHEHRVIEQVIDCLSAMTEEALAKGRLELQPALEAVDFIRTFADRCHHGKEEGALFALLEKKGFPRHHGPLAVMYQEHEQGRAHVEGMAETAAAAGDGDGEALRLFAGHARGYIDLLRGHILKEDRVLYPMADSAFTPQEQEELERSFAQVEAGDMGPGTHERYLEIAARLAQRYNVPRARLAMEPDSECFACGHTCA
jgi:hemerythrin-like domain-containing protein